MKTQTCPPVFCLQDFTYYTYYNLANTTSWGPGAQTHETMKPQKHPSLRKSDLVLGLQYDLKVCFIGQVSHRYCKKKKENTIRRKQITKTVSMFSGFSICIFVVEDFLCSFICMCPATLIQTQLNFSYVLEIISSVEYVPDSLILFTYSNK